MVRLFLVRAGKAPMEQQPDIDGADVSDDEFMCMQCGRCFASNMAVATHRAKAHGYRNPWALRVAGSFCSHCGTDYHTRPRLLQHLSRTTFRSTACADAVLTLPLLTAEELLEADARDAAQARACRRAGLHRLGGLPAARASSGGGAGGGGFAVAAVVPALVALEVPAGVEVATVSDGYGCAADGVILMPG